MTAWANLIDALAETEPSCRDDDRFSDDVTTAAELKPVCDECPVFDLCRAAVDEAPRGFFWGVVGGRERRTGRQVRDRSVSRAG